MHILRLTIITLFLILSAPSFGAAAAAAVAAREEKGILNAIKIPSLTPSEEAEAERWHNSLVDTGNKLLAIGEHNIIINNVHDRLRNDDLKYEDGTPVSPEKREAVTAMFKESIAEMSRELMGMVMSLNTFWHGALTPEETSVTMILAKAFQENPRSSPTDVVKGCLTDMPPETMELWVILMRLARQFHEPHDRVLINRSGKNFYVETLNTVVKPIIDAYRTAQRLALLD